MTFIVVVPLVREKRVVTGAASLPRFPSGAVFSSQEQNRPVAWYPVQHHSGAMPAALGGHAAFAK